MAGTVRSVAFSPDGRSALSGSDDKTIKLWDVATGNEIRSFAGHSGHVTFDRVLARRPNRAVRQRRQDAQALGRRDGKGDPHLRRACRCGNSVAFSPDGRSALSGSSDRTLKLWDVATGKEIRTFTGHADMVWSVAFSPDGRTALSGSDDNTLKLWDVATGKEIRTFAGHTHSGPIGRVLARRPQRAVRQLRQNAQALGRRDGKGDPHLHRAYQMRSLRSRSRPTAEPRCPAATTRPSSSGT